MRDIAVSLIIFGAIPFILKYPWTGVLLSAWVSMFNPHRWAYGFAYDFPYAIIVGVATVAGMALNSKQVRLPINSITVHLMILPVWMTVTLLFALDPGRAYEVWNGVMKVFFYMLVTASLLNSRKHVEALLWVLVLSIGFYGVKGGIFTLLGGGGEKVFGPPGTSFLSDNNAIAVALLMIIPLMHYLAGTAASKWVRWGMYGAMPLCGMAVLGSQSRGAFLGFGAMILFLWLKSRQKFLTGIALLVIVPLAIGFMPETWTKRMETTKTYEEDVSAQGRLNAWTLAFNIANDRIVGGGFDPNNARVYAIYAPNPADVRSAHSVYFQVLGEHGWIGIALFFSLGFASWRLARRLIRASRNRPDFAWAADLARAIQVSFIGFAVGGAFVNIAYWELQYYEIIILMTAYRLASAVVAKPGQVERKRQRLAAT